jgi:hypothetical protein
MYKFIHTVQNPWNYWYGFGFADQRDLWLPGYGIVGNLYGLAVPDPDPEIIFMVQHP